MLDELDVGLHADGGAHRVGDLGAHDGGTACPGRGVADPEAQGVELAPWADHLEQPSGGLVDALDGGPHVPGQDRHAVDDDLVALAAERPDPPVGAPAAAHLGGALDDVVGAIPHERRHLVEQRGRDELTPLAVTGRGRPVRVEVLDERGVLPVVAAVVLGALGGSPDVTEAGLEEQLETPRLDAAAGPRPDRLPGEHHPGVGAERVVEVLAELGGGRLDHHHQRTGQRVPAGGAQLAAEPEQLGDVLGLVVDEHRGGADPADRVVDVRSPEREQAMQEVVAGPAAELPELAHQEAGAPTGVGGGRRVAGRARRREDRAEHLLQARVVRVEAEQPAVGVVVAVAVGANGVLVDERHPLAEVVHRGEVVGAHPGGVPRLPDQRGALVRPGQQVAEQRLVASTLELVPGSGLDLGGEVAPARIERGHGSSGAAPTLAPVG